MQPLKRLPRNEVPTKAPNRLDCRNRSDQLVPRTTRLFMLSSRVAQAAPDSPRRRVDAVLRSATLAAAAFPHFVLAVCSMLTAEFLAGCAAYAHAMYPHFVPWEDVEPSAESERETTNWASDKAQGTGQTLHLVARQRNLHADMSVVHRPQWQPRRLALVTHDFEPRDSVRRYRTLGWYASVSATAGSLWNWTKERRAIPRAMIELGAPGDRASRNIEIIRDDEVSAARGEIDLR